VVAKTMSLVADHGLPAAEIADRTRPALDPDSWWSVGQALGAAEYRAGRFAAAIAALERPEKKPNLISNWKSLFLAMAYHRHRHGRPARARAWLAQAKPEANAGWQERLLFERLRAEAEQVLRTASPARGPE